MNPKMNSQMNPQMDENIGRYKDAAKNRGVHFKKSRIKRNSVYGGNMVIAMAAAQGSQTYILSFTSFLIRLSRKYSIVSSMIIVPLSS